MPNSVVDPPAPLQNQEIAMLIRIDERRLGALLAGLRLLQAHACDGYESPEILRVFSDGRVVEPLDETAIDDFCRALEEGGLAVDEADVTAIETVWTQRAAAQGYEGERRQDLSVEFFAGAMAARHAAGMARWCPPKWWVALIRGRPIDGPADD